MRHCGVCNLKPFLVKSMRDLLRKIQGKEQISQEKPYSTDKTRKQIMNYINHRVKQKVLEE